MCKKLLHIWGSRDAMGAQVGCLLKAACVAVNGLAVLRGLILYKRLPDEAIPMKFGIFGEVGGLEDISGTRKAS